MKTCTFKKALSLLIAVMMVMSCLTVLSVNAAAVKWEDNKFKTAQELYDLYKDKLEWIPVGQTSGNGTYEEEKPSYDGMSAFIYAFGQDSTKIFAFIEISSPGIDQQVTLRLDSNRDTLTARSHELKFKFKGDNEWEQVNEEKGVDVDVPDSVTNGKFTNGKTADFAGTSFMKGNSYEFDVIPASKNYNGEKQEARTPQVLVIQLRKDRLQGNAGNGNFDYVGALGFDIELNSGKYGTVHSSNAGVKAADDATNFNVYSVKEDRVVRFECDGKITGNEFWKDDQWQLVTGLNGQIIGNVDQTDIAYDFQITGDTTNIYIGARLYGQSYKDGDNASSFKVYLNTDRENAKKAGYEPNAILEFVFNGTKYEFAGNNTEFKHLETETTIADDGHAEIEIKIPYRDIRLASYNIVENPYNYIGFNFEYTAPAAYSDEQALISLVARTYGKDADHPAYNCEEANYFTFRSNYADYMNYVIDKYNSLDYNGNLAYEGGKVDAYDEEKPNKAGAFNGVDMLVRELADDYATNKQVITYRVSDALKTGTWTNGKPGAIDNKAAAFLNSYFDYVMFSDGTKLYVGVKGYQEILGVPGDFTQDRANNFRIWLAREGADWGSGSGTILDVGFTIKENTCDQIKDVCIGSRVNHAGSYDKTYIPQTDLKSFYSNDTYAFAFAVDAKKIFCDMDRNLALEATVVGGSPEYVVTDGPWPSDYSGKVNDGTVGEYGKFGNKWAAFYNNGGDNPKNNYDGKIGQIVLDFGAKKDFSSFRTHIWGTHSDAGVGEMEKVEFFVSDDNETWTSVGAVTENLTGNGVWVELKKEASGRYVKYAYTKKAGDTASFLFVSECQAIEKAVFSESAELKYAITHSFYTKRTPDGKKALSSYNGYGPATWNHIEDSYCQMTSGRYMGTVSSGYTTNDNGYRVINAKNPAIKLVRKDYVANESLKKNVLADVFYTVDYGYHEDDAISSGKIYDKKYSEPYVYYDYRIKPALSDLIGKAERGFLNDGKFGFSSYASKHEDRTFAALKNNMGQIWNSEQAKYVPFNTVVEADAANSVTFQLLRSYNLAGFKAEFTSQTSGGVGAPNYVDVYVSNGTDTQRVGRYYGTFKDDGTTQYEIVLNRAVVGNKVTFKFDNTYTILFATEFQAYAYGDIIVTTKGANASNGGYDPAMIFGQNANNLQTMQYWRANSPVFKYDTNLGAYYRVNETVPAYGQGGVGNYKKGDFAIAIHDWLVDNYQNKRTDAQKANLDLLNTIALGERVYLYNDAHADANYDLMMQPTNSNFYITIGNPIMSKAVTAYNPTIGYKYSFTDLGQIGDGKSTMVLIDSQSKPHDTTFTKDNPPVDSFLVGELLDSHNSNINLWNYYVITVEYDETAKAYYVSDYKPAITRDKNWDDDKWAEEQKKNNADKRNMPFTTQGFAIVSLNNGEMTSRLSRMWANDYTLGVNKDNAKAPDAVYLYDVDLDALRLSYGNAGALNAKVTFNNKNGKDNVTVTESWVDLAESNLDKLTERWMQDLKAIKSQISEKAYEEYEKKITNNLKYCRAYALFANKFNSHEYTAGLRANPWVMYDKKTEVENLSFDENIFALWNRNSQWSIGATQTAGIMLMNTNANYEKKTETTGFDKNFAILHDKDYTSSRNYLNKITYTFYYDFANGYAVPETLRIYTSANYSFMNHTKPYEVSLKDKTADNGAAYPTTGSGTWTITVDMPLTTATAIYTEFDFTSKQLGVVEINEKCVIADLMTSEINSLTVTVETCKPVIAKKETPALTYDVTEGVVTINHDHSKHNADNCSCNTDCKATVNNKFYGNTFIDLEATPYLHLVMDVPTNLSATSFTMNVWYKGVSRRIALDNIIAREVSNGKIDYFFDFADFCKNTYGMDLKDGKLLQLENWTFETKFADNTTSTIKISKFEFIPASGVVADLVAGSTLELDADKKLLILDQQYKEEALRQQFTGAITVEGTAKNGFVGTGAKVTVNGTVYTVVLYGDLNGDGAISPADYIMIRRAILKTLELDDVQEIAAIGPKASKITATTYIQIRQHVLGTYNFFKGEKIAQ